MNFAVSNNILARRHHPVTSFLKTAPAVRPTAFTRDTATASPCACGGGCPRCTGKSLLPPAADFSGVRLHPSAPEVTGPLQARAVTMGQDVYFHPGQFRPGTPEGETLIAHELAHTLQTRRSAVAAARPSAFVSEPGDAWEKNAGALARGETAHALAAPAGAALRSPFDSETADQQSRRQRLLQSISNAINTLIRLLQTRGLLQNVEVAVVRGGAQGVIYGAHTAGTPQEVFTSYPDRDARIRRIIRSLGAMGTLYRTAPIPAAFAPPTVDATGTYSSSVSHPAGSGLSTSNYSAASAEWVDLQAAYERYCMSQGMTPDQYESDWYYIDPSNTIVPGAARGAPRLATGIQTGAYMVVPDIEHEPLRYWRLTGSSPTPRGSVIIELWHDDLGYYYMNHDQRIDVPDPWTH